jgi:hypothetical protein
MSDKEAKHDLQHYLRLALAQLQHKITTEKTTTGKYTDELRRLLLLEELVKEQVVTK